MERKSVREGQIAPDFSLPESSGQVINLREGLRKGPIILAFYPTDWGIICTLEMKTFKTMVSELDMLGVRLIGISVNSPASHRSWKEQLELSFPLLADQDGSVASSYGVLRENVEFLVGHNDRAVFIIDQEQKVRYIWIAKDPSIQPDYDLIMEISRAIVK